MGDLFTKIALGIGTQALHLALPTLASALAALVMVLVHRLATKAGIELTSAQDAVLRQDVHDAVLAVEELSRQQKGTPAETASEDKLNMAVRMVQAKHPELGTLTVEDKVHAALPVVRQQMGAFSTMAR